MLAFGLEISSLGIKNKDKIMDNGVWYTKQV